MTSGRRFAHPAATPTGLRLYGHRVMLRPLTTTDFATWSAVRVSNEDWLTPWEPRRTVSMFDPTRDREAFVARCTARDRERVNGVAYGFGLFVDNTFAGEVNLNNVIRGALQCGTIGYWIDRSWAGHRYVAEAVVVLARFAFDELRLHRLEICIVPRNSNSRRVMEVLAFREEGVALRYLEINGVWEDHVRYGVTAEDWQSRRDELISAWLS
ncbi:MAG: GNAT family protein [Ilumatobacteraceae bacterium]